ncbi:PRP38 pre-mRNA processing factor 38 domain-containing protein B [Entophlyctis sp. JEL0112]|nr:PRP38 pre-mRNA processing factor 38 domain-containing protein B [Entophlyctis sp. JEL0112]
MSNKLKTVGNEQTMNINNLLYQNIIASPYFKNLFEKKTFDEIVDEIYSSVTSLEPFLKATHASTAFCLLYKLWTIRLTVKQIEFLIDNPDSPHIRAIGFLYLRYVCEPTQLWDWFGDYLEDEEEVRVEGGVRPTVWTIGKVCRVLLTDAKWLGTILPRIPVPVMRDLEAKLKEYGKETTLANTAAQPLAIPANSAPRRTSGGERDAYRGGGYDDDYLDYGSGQEDRRGDSRRPPYTAYPPALPAGRRDDRHSRSRSRSPYRGAPPSRRSLSPRVDYEDRDRNYSRSRRDRDRDAEYDRRGSGSGYDRRDDDRRRSHGREDHRRGRADDDYYARRR